MPFTLQNGLLQLTDETGYTNFDKPLTQLYPIWISLLRLISKKLILGY